MRGIYRRWKKRQEFIHIIAVGTFVKTIIHQNIIMQNIIIRQCYKTVSLDRILANKSAIVVGSPLLYCRATNSLMLYVATLYLC